MSQSKHKRLLTLKEKIDVIEFYNKEKSSIRILAKKFNIGKTQASNIINKREDLLSKWNSNENVSQKRSFFKLEGYNIDKVTYDWFVQARAKNIPLSGTLIRSKAKEVAEQLRYQNFNASSGWLERFKKRHNITFRTISGESASVNPNDVKEFGDKIADLLAGYDPKDIYNADETGLFFRALPEKTFAFRGEKCSGGKMAKERVTVLCCANMAGDSEKLLVIGKAARPRSFGKINLNSLPVHWRSNRKAWMTCDIMKEFLLQFDQKMQREKRKIVLFLDNAASHPRDLKLSNISIRFLPPNTTSFCQPLDQGIIQNFKTWYRSIILKRILSKLESVTSSEELVKSITVLDAIYIIQEAWRKVSPVTIQNCFKKAGFKHSNSFVTNMAFDPEDEEPLSVIAERCKMMLQVAPNNTTFEEYVGVDDNLCLEEDNINLNYDQIIDMTDVLEFEGSDADDEIQESEQDGSIKTHKEALLAVKDLKLFTSSSGDLIGYEILSKLESHFEKRHTKTLNQKTILDFFKIPK